MLAGICLPFVNGFTSINAVIQQTVEVALVDQRPLLVFQLRDAARDGRSGGGAGPTRRPAPAAATEDVRPLGTKKGRPCRRPRSGGRRPYIWMQVSAVSLVHSS